MSDLLAISDTRLKEPAGNACFIPGTRVLLDGQDISADCWRAEQYSDGSLRAHCFSRNAEGVFYYDRTTQDVAREVREGQGRIIPPECVSSETWELLQERWRRLA